MSRRLVAALLVLGTLLSACATGRSTGTTAAPTPTIPGVQVFTGLKHDHPAHQHVVYAQTPPVGGPHAPYWIACATYQTELPNEFAVHAMEHGAVWITYRPGLPQASVARLEALAAIRPDYTLISPFTGQPTAVSVQTWGLQLQVSDAADPRIEQFVRAYVAGSQGGEPGADCKGGVSLAQAASLLRPA